MATKKSSKLSVMNYLLIMIGVSVLVVGASVVIGRGQVVDIVQQINIQNAKNKANNQLDADSKSAAQLITNYQNLDAPTKALIADSLPQTADQPGFLVILDSMAKQAGLTLRTYSPAQLFTSGLPAAGSDMPAAQTMDVSLSLTGNYTALNKMLGLIEQSSRPIRVNGIQVSGSGGSLSIQLSVTTYFQDKASLPFKSEELK
jgi:hypothetical protein